MYGKSAVRSTHEYVMSDHHSRFSCGKCDHKFSSKKKLTDHIRAAHPAAPHMCEICGKIFKEKSYLIKHVRSKHVNPRSETCEKCEKTFSQKGGLFNHDKFNRCKKI